jgi:hypothetical protein
LLICISFKLYFHFAANDPWNPIPQNGSGLGSHPDSAFSPLAVTSKFSQNNNNDPWSLGGGGGGASAAVENSMDPFSPNAQKQLQEFDLLREEIDHHAPLAATGKQLLFISFSSFTFTVT